MRGVCGAGENAGGARRGHWSRDRGAKELSGTDHSHTGENVFVYTICEVFLFNSFIISFSWNTVRMDETFYEYVNVTYTTSLLKCLCVCI